MAARKPLVIVSGQIQQLANGDTLLATTTDTTAVALTNADSVPVVFGMPVYPFGVDSVKRAEANALGTSYPVGLAMDTSITASASGNIAIAGILSASSTALWDAVAGTTGGLVFCTTYFLDPATPGKITATAPSTAGQYVTVIGQALSTLELKLNIQPPIGL